MRRYNLMILALFVSLFTCCDKPEKKNEEIIWDFVPKNICLILCDREGDNNLLDPRTEGNILENDIRAYHNGNEYLLNEYFGQAKTRIIRPNWYGLRVGKYYGYNGDDGTPALLFGQFGPTFADDGKHYREDGKGYHGEIFTIEWGDGSPATEVMFDFYITWSYNKKENYDEPTVHKKLWIDGVMVSDTELTAIAIVE